MFIVAAPELSNANIGAVPTVVIDGAIASTTVTLNVSVELLFEASVEVTITTLTPTSAQVKLDTLYSNAELLQLSTAEAVANGSDTTPLLVKFRVISATVITGAVTSITLTALVAIEVLPASSVAVMVTVTEPKSSQSNELGETVNDGFAVQLSVASLTTSAETNEASPLASSAMSTLPDTTVIDGASLSSTVPVIPLYVVVLVLKSVTVTLKVTEPRSSQSTVAGVITTDSIPQLS